MADRRQVDVNLNADFDKLASKIRSAFSETMEPFMSEFKDELSSNKEETAKIVKAISGIKIAAPAAPNVSVNVPPINVPQPKVTVNAPSVTIPPFPKFPEQKSILDGVSMKNPIPVIMTNSDGTPFTQSSILGGGGGGGFRHIIIDDIRASASSLIDQVAGALRVTGDLTVTGSASSTLAQLVNADGTYFDSANPLPVVFGASATQAVNMVDSSGVAYSGSNPVPVVFGASASQGTALLDSGGVQYSGSNPVPVSTQRALESIGLDVMTVRQVSGVSDSVYVAGIFGSLATALTDSTGVQYSGSNPVPVAGTVVVSSITASTASALVDSNGDQYSGSNPVPVSTQRALESIGLDVMTTRQVSGVSDSVYVTGVFGSLGTALTDSTGVQYSGSNPVPVTLISGGLTSTIAVGSVAADVADDGSAPVQSGGVARTTNPTAVANGDVVKATHDDLGRQVMRPLQVRDLLATAYVQLTNGTEATLLAAGGAGVAHDLVYVMGANNSDAAATIDIRAVTAGNVVMSLQIPANGTAGLSLSGSPYPQSEVNNNWTVDMNDITGTTISLSALFSKEI